MSWWLLSLSLASYQTEGDTAKLDHISVGHTVEAAYPGVEHGDQGRAYHGRVKIHLEDDGQGGACAEREGYRGAKAFRLLVWSSCLSRVGDTRISRH